MSKTPKPLRIVFLDADLAESPEVKALIAKGHVVTVDELPGVDLVMGRRAWLMTEKHMKYLSNAIASGWERRYPKETDGTTEGKS